MRSVLVRPANNRDCARAENTCQPWAWEQQQQRRQHCEGCVERQHWLDSGRYVELGHPLLLRGARFLRFIRFLRFLWRWRSDADWQEP